MAKEGDKGKKEDLTFIQLFAEEALQNKWQPSPEDKRKELKAREKMQKAGFGASIAFLAVAASLTGLLVIGQSEGGMLDLHGEVPAKVALETSRNPDANTRIITNYYNRTATEQEDKNRNIGLLASVLALANLGFSYSNLKTTRRKLKDLAP